jgi:hypothetical protein
MLVVAVTTGCYNRHSLPPQGSFAESGNCTFAEVRSVAEGGCHTFTSDKVVVGSVTSSDAAFNFYRTLFIEDGSGAVELLIGNYNMQKVYPVGLQVALRLEGLAVALVDGVVQVGLPPESYDIAPREIGAQVTLDRHLICGTSVEPIEPLLCDIPTLDDAMCGRLVRVRSLAHSPLDDEVEYRRYVDENQQVLYIYISDHSSLVAPEQIDALTGILSLRQMEEGSVYVITPRFEDDFATLHSSN